MGEKAEKYPLSKREVFAFAFGAGIVAGILITLGLLAVLPRIPDLLTRSMMTSPPIVEPDERVEASYEIAYADAGGETVELETHRGRTVLLNFWATWCRPCVIEMPEIQDLHDHVNDNGLDVAIVTISREDPERVASWMERNGYTFPVYSIAADLELPEPYDHHGIPTTYIITPDGRVAVDHTGAALWNGRKVRELFASLR